MKLNERKKSRGMEEQMQMNKKGKKDCCKEKRNERVDYLGKERKREGEKEQFSQGNV